MHNYDINFINKTIAISCEKSILVVAVRLIILHIISIESGENVIKMLGRDRKLLQCQTILISAHELGSFHPEAQANPVLIRFKSFKLSLKDKHPSGTSTGGVLLTGDITLLWCWWNLYKSLSLMGNWSWSVLWVHCISFSCSDVLSANSWFSANGKESLVHNNRPWEITQAIKNWIRFFVYLNLIMSK